MIVHSEVLLDMTAGGDIEFHWDDIVFITTAIRPAIMCPEEGGFEEKAVCTDTCIYNCTSREHKTILPISVYFKKIIHQPLYIAHFNCLAGPLRQPGVEIAPTRVVEDEILSGRHIREFVIAVRIGSGQQGCQGAVQAAGICLET